MLFIIADKARARGEDVKRCRCGERQRAKKLEDGEASRTLVTRGKGLPKEKDRGKKGKK